MTKTTSNISPLTHPAGTAVLLKTIDNMEIKGKVETYTSDAVLIKTEKSLVRLHPHEIYLAIKA